MNVFKFTLLSCVMLLSTFSAQASVIILNGLTHIHETEKGAVIEGSVNMHNTSKIDQRVNIYINDIEQNCDGEIIYFPADTLARSLASWIDFNTTERVLTPNEKFTLKYTITVPADFEPGAIDFGSFWAGLMVELAKPIGEDVQRGVQLNSKIRYCIQLIAQLGEVISPEIEFNSVDFNKTGTEGDYAIDLQLKNNGDYMVQPIVILELFDAAGNSVNKSEAVFKKVYPNSCKDFKLVVSDIPLGDYDGVIVADYGGEMFGVNLALTVD